MWVTRYVKDGVFFDAGKRIVVMSEENSEINNHVLEASRYACACVAHSGDPRRRDCVYMAGSNGRGYHLCTTTDGCGWSGEDAENDIEEELLDQVENEAIDEVLMLAAAVHGIDVEGVKTFLKEWNSSDTVWTAD